MDKLRRAVTAIQKSKPVTTSLEELYSAVENLCSSGRADAVYATLKELVEAHVNDSVAPFLGDALSDKLVFMKRLNECWAAHCSQMVMVGIA